MIDGNTHYYVCLENSEDIFDVAMTDEYLIGIIRYQVGDIISIKYHEGYGLQTVTNIK